MEEVAEVAVIGGDPQQPEGTRVRRRLVQSTLFPHRAQDNGKESALKVDGYLDEESAEKDDEDDEYCASQGDKRKGRTRKAKTTPQSGASKKIHQKVSEIWNQIQPLKEQYGVGSPEDDDKISSPPEYIARKKSPQQQKRQVNATREKRRTNTTPRKNVVKRELKEACFEKASTCLLQSEHTLPQIPNLRLEAEMIAKENTRIFAGRQIHPFFQSWKMGKRDQEITDVECKWCSIERKDEGITFSPIHVFEKVQEDNVSLEWGNWLFMEKSLSSTNCDPECVLTSASEGSVKSLLFDNYSSNSRPTKMLFHQADVSLGQDTEDPAGRGRNSLVEWQGKLLQERMMSCFHACGNQPENSLWTNKYQPEKAIEVCGNGGSVKFLSEWLRLWHEKGFQIIKNSSSDYKCNMENGNYDPNGSDYELEDINEENSLKNVLLVTGPVGSGKSAAIYACAKEQGFQVIEINASDWRNGALIMQKFGEAVKSHWLQRSSSAPEGPACLVQHQSKSSSVTPNAATIFENEVTELIPSSDEEDSQGISEIPGKSSYMVNKTVGDRSEIKTLMLFEDVDTTLYEDRGFISTIQQLAETAKRPMILTSNSNSPVLPNNLDRLEVCFTIPSADELLRVALMVCAVEKATIQPCLVERFVKYYQGDIRKIIMHLQFWCQGRSYGEDNTVDMKYSPLLFDIDAGHRTLPKIIPWGCSSQLSEVVEKAISESSSKVENSGIISMIKEEQKVNENMTMQNNEPSSIMAKKEAMLRRHFFNESVNEFAIQFDGGQFSPSDSPVAFTRRNVRRKYDAVSSDSEELCSELPLVSGKPFGDVNSNKLLEVSSKSHSHCPVTERCCNSLNQLVNTEMGNLEGNQCHCSETSKDYSNANGICETIDVSSVPESSFVPETVLENETMLFSSTVSCGHVADRLDRVPMHIDLDLNSLPPDDDGLDDCICGSHEIPEIIGDASDINTESVQGEVGDSDIPSIWIVPSGNHVMDECSRIVFNKRANSREKSTSEMEIDSIQETWRKLRSSRADFRRHVTPEERDATKVSKLAYAMSDLISVTDLLLSGCQPLIHDSLVPSLVSFEESYSFCGSEDQLQMSSTLAQHGMCSYAKEVAAAVSKMGRQNNVDLGWEMLSASANTMALGKLVRQEAKIIENLEMGSPRSRSLKSNSGPFLCNIVQSVVPSRSHLALKGEAFHEYLSSLCMISRIEASRLSEHADRTRLRRARTARNYLSSGALMLSPEDTSLLCQYNSYSKPPCH